MTQAELGYHSGFSMGAIRNLEQGKNGTSFTNLERLADALNVEVRDLFDFSQLDHSLNNDDKPVFPPMLPL